RRLSDRRVVLVFKRGREPDSVRNAFHQDAVIEEPFARARQDVTLSEGKIALLGFHVNPGGRIITADGDGDPVREGWGRCAGIVASDVDEGAPGPRGPRRFAIRGVLAAEPPPLNRFD